MTAPGVTRRRFGALVGAGLVAGCVGGPGRRTAVPKAAEADAALEAHRAAMDLQAVGLVVQRDGETVYSGASGWASGLSPDEVAAGVARRPFTVETPFRVASMSKAAVARTAIALSRDDRVDLDADVQTRLDFPLRHPEAPDTPITLAMLLSHTSGIRDPDAYWVPVPGTISEVVDGAVFAPLEGRRPGDYFEYANLNTGLAATVLERATGERFDQLARALVLAPAGVDGGFNWAGMSAERRAQGGTLYRRGEGGDWVIQIDGPDALAGTEPTILSEDGFALDDYAIGTNGTLFSPQGGLRASLTDLQLLADRYRQTPEMMSPQWLRNEAGDNGLHDGGYFAGTGLGTLHYPAAASPFPGRAVWGHQGEAYGVHGAFWTTPDGAFRIAYVALGVPEETPPPGRHPGLNAYVAPLADLGAMLG